MINIDFSDLPSDVALVLSQQEHTTLLAEGLARCMRLDDAERQLIRYELVGAVAEVVDDYLEGATRPRE
jgi:hypothetical protein